MKLSGQLKKKRGLKQNIWIFWSVRKHTERSIFNSKYRVEKFQAHFFSKKYFLVSYYRIENFTCCSGSEYWSNRLTNGLTLLGQLAFPRIIFFLVKTRAFFFSTHHNLMLINWETWNYIIDFLKSNRILFIASSDYISSSAHQTLPKMTNYTRRLVWHIKHIEQNRVVYQILQKWNIIFFNTSTSTHFSMMRNKIPIDNMTRVKRVKL